MTSLRDVIPHAHKSGIWGTSVNWSITCHGGNSGHIVSIKRNTECDPTSSCTRSKKSNNGVNGRWRKPIAKHAAIGQKFLKAMRDEEASYVFQYSQLVRCRAEKSGQCLTAHHRCKYERSARSTPTAEAEAPPGAFLYHCAYSRNENA